MKLLLPKIEQALEPFRARPHWGKLFAYTPEQLQDRYIGKRARWLGAAARNTPPTLSRDGSIRAFAWFRF